MREDNGKEETRAKVQTEADKYVRWSREETTLGERGFQYCSLHGIRRCLPFGSAESAFLGPEAQLSIFTKLLRKF